MLGSCETCGFRNGKGRGMGVEYVRTCIWDRDGCLGLWIVMLGIR